MPKPTSSIATQRKTIFEMDDEIAQLDKKLRKTAEKKAQLERQVREHEMLLQLALLAAEKHPAFISRLYEKLEAEDRARIDGLGFQEFSKEKIEPALAPKAALVEQPSP
jgi:septal ring factor EnvC (AmiA/AmiB activator)